MEVLLAIVALVVLAFYMVVRTYYANTWRERRDRAFSESSRSIERQFERPPNENDLL